LPLMDVKIRRTGFSSRRKWLRPMKLLWSAEVYEMLLFFAFCSGNLRVPGDVLSGRTFRTSWIHRCIILSME
jgi:hypothetical protein